ncbi:hypothetical protein PR048_010845 [Dryococelus australis]|uniref:CO dehydrogenase flavoprotein C-terminal domain-containing protein n=1 Tax=Dryococelus australis TaxID=614101 RepID=A0ABQ9I3V6_9NEOP|nr:hypothetical protein PR048_010845 [Dryococelus australis]
MECTLREKVSSGLCVCQVHASRTEAYLVGKDLCQQDTLTKALQQLNSEVKPDVRPLEMAPQYRKGLAASLFYKVTAASVLHPPPTLTTTTILNQ